MAVATIRRLERLLLCRRLPPALRRDPGRGRPLAGGGGRTPGGDPASERELPDAAHVAHRRLADLRVRQGRFEEAQRLLEGPEWHPTARRCLAAVALGRRRASLAEELASCAWRAWQRTTPHCAPVLEPAGRHPTSPETTWSLPATRAPSSGAVRARRPRVCAWPSSPAAAIELRGRTRRPGGPADRARTFTGLRATARGGAGQARARRRHGERAPAAAANEARLAFDEWLAWGHGADADAAAALLRASAAAAPRSAYGGALTKREARSCPCSGKGSPTRRSRTPRHQPPHGGTPRRAHPLQARPAQPQRGRRLRSARAGRRSVAAIGSPTDAPSRAGRSLRSQITRPKSQRRRMAMSAARTTRQPCGRASRTRRRGTSTALDGIVRRRLRAAHPGGRHGRRRAEGDGPGLPWRPHRPSSHVDQQFAAGEYVASVHHHGQARRRPDGRARERAGRLLHRAHAQPLREGQNRRGVGDTDMVGLLGQVGALPAMATIRRRERSKVRAPLLRSPDVTRLCAMSSAEPQPVLTPLTEAAIILVLTVPAWGGEDAVRDLLPDILPDDVKPANSHCRAQHDRRQGRRGTPDRAAQHAVRAGRRRRVRHLLHRLHGGHRCDRADADQHVRRSPPGNHDRILDFSTAVTGCLFFAPSADFLDDPPVDAPADAGAVQRGSLGIGSLKGDSS